MSVVYVLLMFVGAIFLTWLIDTFIHSLPYKYMLKAIPIVFFMLLIIAIFPLVNTAFNSVTAVMSMPFNIMQQTRNMYFDEVNNQHLLLDDNMQLVENPDGTKTIKVNIGF